ncbi:hypothetical protein [Clostridium gasigenes]|uniref:hypothetical protein n=1 Tax=Clostridium gasigenes TaxID=94869 RepID=UPI001C0E6907|nr:hypothetical protein [Clostridium gasigenes]MBU3107163.1 hypothetical protein [Clostridium gasigenes]
MQIVLVIGVYLLVIDLYLNFFTGASILYKNSITLKPINFKKSPIGQPTLIEELHKCKEEDDEFQIAVLKNDIDNAIEEFYDSVQTKINCLDMMGIPIEIVCRDQDKHYLKLNSRGIKFK